MRILWLTENYYPNRGGMAQSCDRIVHSLRQAGVYIDLIHLSSRKQKLKNTAVLTGSNITFPLNSDPAHTLNLLWNYLNHPDRKTSYTHILVFGGYLPVLAGPMFARWLDLPLLVCLRGNDVDSAIFMPRRRTMLKDALSYAAAVCLVTKDKMEKLQKWIPEGRFFHTPNGIDLSIWEPSKSELQKARAWKMANVLPHQKLIGIFGHLKAKKGLDVLIEALGMQALSSQIHLLISGEVEEDWEGPLNEKELSFTHIPFLDRHQLLAWYPACDLVVIPSHYEGMPNILLEAGALGIPILASRIDGMKDMLEEHQLGWLFHPGDVEECRSALWEFIRCSPAKLLNMGEAFRSCVRTHYTHEQEARRYIDIFEKTLNFT